MNTIADVKLIGQSGSLFTPEYASAMAEAYFEQATGLAVKRARVTGCGWVVGQYDAPDYWSVAVETAAGNYTIRVLYPGEYNIWTGSADPLLEGLPSPREVRKGLRRARKARR